MRVVMEMNKKTVLVTGSSIGLGAKIIEKFASNNYNCVINYLTHEQEALNLKNEIINKYNVKCICIKADITNDNDVFNMYNEIIDNFGKIDVLINNAGISNDNLIENKTKEDFMKIFEVNVYGTFNLSKLIGKHMYENKTGKIINISSTNAIDTYYEYSIDYDASKAAIINLTHNLANIYSPYVNVNCICPGWINTNMNKNMSSDFKKEEENKILLKRFAEPSEIANVVYFLSTDDAKYVNDSIIRVDGGKKC